MMTTSSSPSAPFAGLTASWDARAAGAAIAAGDVFSQGVKTAEPAPLDGGSAARPPENSLTLARLYLRQGHVREARTILQEILRQDPADRRARLELNRLAVSPRRLSALDLLPELKDAHAVHAAAPALRLALLRELLRRLQSLD